MFSSVLNWRLDYRRCAQLVAIVLLVVFAIPSVAVSQAMNDKVIKFVRANVGKRVGGGESTDAVSEALRTSGAAFTENDLGADYPDSGDRLWGSPVKVVSYANEILADSNPTTSVLPGDILQFKNARFVYVTTKGRRVSTTRMVSFNQHSAVVARTNRQGILPSQVYEQDAPNTDNLKLREVALNPIDFSSLRGGMVFFYRPKVRIDSPGKYQISIVNNTNATKLPVVKSKQKTVMNLSLERENTASSYSVAWMNSANSDVGFRLFLPNGAAMAIENACSYEIYKGPTGVVSIRKLSP